jgi:hypothetical protein
VKWLAMIYVKRMKWEKLKNLSERMEQLTDLADQDESS